MFLFENRQRGVFRLMRITEDYRYVIHANADIQLINLAPCLPVSTCETQQDTNKIRGKYCLSELPFSVVILGQDPTYKP